MNEKRERQKIIHKAVPIWLVSLLVLIPSVSVVWTALTVQNTTKASLFGEIYTVTEELSVMTQGIDISPSAKSAAGTDSGSPVILTAPGAKVRTDIAKANYYYSVELSIVTTSANTKYNATLYQEQSDAWVYIDSLYIQQSTTPSVGDKATLSWDIGSSLETSTYKVDIEIYT
jgi:hypothetical protein